MSTMEKTIESDKLVIDDFTEIMSLYGNSLLHYCFLMLGDASLAEDATQETFLKAFKNISHFRGESSLKTWLMRIAANTCRSYLRSPWMRKVDHRISIEDIDIVADESSYKDDTVTKAIMRLPRKQREAIVVYYYESNTIQETARILSATIPAIKYRLDRARQKLFNELKEWFFDEE